MQSAGLSFLGIGFGMILAISTQPFWNRYVIYPTIPPLDSLSQIRHFLRQCLKFDGSPPPETRLIMGQVGAILVPVGKPSISFDAQ